MAEIISRLFVMRFALGNEKCLGVLRAADFVDKTIRIVNPTAPVAIPIFQWFWFSDAVIAIALNVLNEGVDPLQSFFILKLPSGVFVPCARREGDCHFASSNYASIRSCTWPSPRSSERMDSASIRWLVSDQNGSGLSDITSNGRRRRITDWRRNRRMALDISSPAFVNKRSASLRRPLSIRICSVDVAILHSFVIQTNEIISKALRQNKVGNTI